MNNQVFSDKRLLQINGFYSETLGVSRDIQVYLPPSYDQESHRHYPVLYMHDGQGIFHPNPVSGTSWNMHLTADRLVEEGLMHEVIIVGIDNLGEERKNEYSFGLKDGEIPGATDIECRGEKYERFLVHELKPYIDQQFRTLPDRENTALMGSSMGGLVTYHLGSRNPNVYSKLGMLSPYFYRLDLNLMKEVKFYKEFQGTPDQRLWIDIGGIEDNILVRHVREVVRKLIDQGYMAGENLMYREWPRAAHTEQDWAERVHLPLLYFFGTANVELPLDSLPELHSDTVIPMSVTSDLIDADIQVKVPPGTPQGNVIWIGKLALPRLSAGLFGGRFKLPRGMGVRFKIVTEHGIQEAGPHGENLPYRVIRWDQDMKLECSVKGWSS